MAQQQPTVVVGGGLSGLALALFLHRADVPVTLLESAGTPGGTARTLERDGFLLETGPNSFLDRDGAVAALASSLGVPLRPASAHASRRSLVLGGRLRELPASPAAMFASDVLPWGAKLRLLLEPFSRRGAVGVDESLGDFARRHIGSSLTATMVDALQTGIWAGDIERLSAESAFPRLVALERAYRSLVLGAIRSRRGVGAGMGRVQLSSVEGGLGALSRAAAGALGNRVRLDSAALALERRADGWSIVTPSGVLEAPRVVLALPPTETAGLVRPFDSALAEALASFPSVPVAVVHLGFHPRLDPEPQGFGFLVPPRERRDILGALYVSSAFPFRAPRGGTLLTVLLGGAHRPELLALDDAGLLRTARRELAALLGLQREPTLTQVFRWPRAIPQYNVGHAQRVQSILAQAGRWPGLWLAGNAYRGAGVADCVRVASELGRRLLAG
ncbi:MAG: protoporphyrinogen oxidase [Myxococcaceae bacterium]